MIFEIETLVFGGGLVIAIIYFLSKSNSKKTRTERSNNQKLETTKASSEKTRTTKSNNRKTRTEKSSNQKVETTKASTQKAKTTRSNNRKTRATKPSNQKTQTAKSSNRKARTTKSSKIPDAEVSVKQLIKKLEKMTLKKEDLKIISRKKEPEYEERDVQFLLEEQLRDIYENVEGQYPLEGGGKIDIDIGNGKVGIELKLARSLYKSSRELQSLPGQVQDYIEAKYDSQNLIVVVAGEKEHLNGKRKLDKGRQRVEEKGAHFVFLKIKE